MIKVTSLHKDNIYDTNVEINGNGEEVLIELKTLFESIIQSKHPEYIHAVISHYLPKITEQLATQCISESILSYCMDRLEDIEEVN